jgi:NitT/TauT family transport system substrate-binding protein
LGVGSARQRAEGNRYTFIRIRVPWDALLIPAESPVRTLDDLKGRSLGVAGGALDKSWLLLRALAQRSLIGIRSRLEPRPLPHRLC